MNLKTANNAQNQGIDDFDKSLTGNIENFKSTLLKDLFNGQISNSACNKVDLNEFFKTKSKCVLNTHGTMLDKAFKFIIK